MRKITTYLKSLLSCYQYLVNYGILEKNQKEQKEEHNKKKFGTENLELSTNRTLESQYESTPQNNKKGKNDKKLSWNVNVNESIRSTNNLNIISNDNSSLKGFNTCNLNNNRKTTNLRILSQDSQ